jgi:hypothetical protein
MEYLFLPAVVLIAIALQLAALFILSDEVARLPRLAHFEWIVLEQVGLAPKVLPIVCVYTLSLIMFSVVGTPLSLKVEHVEFLIASHLVDQRRLDILVAVCKTAELLVFAFLECLGAELSFVLFNVVQTLHLVVGVGAVLVAA